MKKIIFYVIMVIIVGLLCYLGLFGYVWYYDKQCSKKSDVQVLVVGENNKILGYFREKGCDYCYMFFVELFFYFFFLVVKQLMDYDIQFGYKLFNLEVVWVVLIVDMLVL